MSEDNSVDLFANEMFSKRDGYNTRSTVYKCKCGKIFTSKEAIRQHRAQYKVLKCGNCDFTTQNIVTMQEHHAKFNHDGEYGVYDIKHGESDP